jgi:hypothetical protein
MVGIRRLLTKRSIRLVRHALGDAIRQARSQPAVPGEYPSATPADFLTLCSSMAMLRLHRLS